MTCEGSGAFHMSQVGPAPSSSCVHNSATADSQSGIATWIPLLTADAEDEDLFCVSLFAVHLQATVYIQDKQTAVLTDSYEKLTFFYLNGKLKKKNPK